MQMQQNYYYAQALAMNSMNYYAPPPSKLLQSF